MYCGLVLYCFVLMLDWLGVLWLVVLLWFLFFFFVVVCFNCLWLCWWVCFYLCFDLSDLFVLFIVIVWVWGFVCGTLVLVDICVVVVWVVDYICVFSGWDVGLFANWYVGFVCFVYLWRYIVAILVWLLCLDWWLWFICGLVLIVLVVTLFIFCC